MVECVLDCEKDQLQSHVRCVGRETRISISCACVVVIYIIYITKKKPKHIDNCQRLVVDLAVARQFVVRQGKKVSLVILTGWGHVKFCLIKERSAVWGDRLACLNDYLSILLKRNAEEDAIMPVTVNNGSRFPLSVTCRSTGYQHITNSRPTVSSRPNRVKKLFQFFYFILFKHIYYCLPQKHLGLSRGLTKIH